MPVFAPIHWRGEAVPRLVLGTVQLGLSYGVNNTAGKPGQDQANQIVATAWQGGITHFDTAQAYGDSETVLGQALAGWPSPAVISKLAPSLDPTDRRAILHSVRQSLDRLAIPQLWGLMLHRGEWLAYWDLGLRDALCTLRDAGQARYLGVSVYSTAEARAALALPDVDFIQLPCSIWDQRPLQEGIFALARDAGKLCFVRSILLQGMLAMAPEQVARRLPRALPAALAWQEALAVNRTTALQAAAAFAWQLEAPLVIGAEQPEQVSDHLQRFSSIARNAAGTPPAAALSDIYRRIAPTLDETILNPAQWNQP